MSQADGLLKLLENGQDNALLRFGIGSALLKEGQAETACEHLARAVEHDPSYSAAWKLYGKALAELERNDEAINVYERGIAMAEEKGDLQAAKEMKVFLKRLQKAQESS
ncbi:MAG: tetratricopeptide repeat protein [Gammaproteobacteria bacterium]|nr:tetratricopeptide repeat protein [Gammaproteobacteria bacterium]